MMSDALSLSERSSQADEAFAELVTEITSKLQAGQPVDVQAYIGQAPQHEQRLRRLIPAVEALVDLGLSSSASAATPSRPRPARPSRARLVTIALFARLAGAGWG